MATRKPCAKVSLRRSGDTSASTSTSVNKTLIFSFDDELAEENSKRLHASPRSLSHRIALLVTAAETDAEEEKKNKKKKIKDTPKKQSSVGSRSSDSSSDNDDWTQFKYHHDEGGNDRLGVSLILKASSSSLACLIEQAFSDRFLEACHTLRRLDLEGLRLLSPVVIGGGGGATAAAAAATSSGSTNAAINFGNDFCYGCKNLEELCLPVTGIASFGDYFCAQCPKLREVTVAKGACDAVTQIPDFFMEGCSALKRVSPSPSSQCFGCAFPNVKNIGVNFLRETGIETISFGGMTSCESIGSFFLYQCESLTRCEFKSMGGVTKVGNSFLSGAVRLEAISFDGLENAVHLDNGFLHGCTSLTKINFNALGNVKYVGDYFLCHCKSLREISFAPFKKLRRIGGNFMSGNYVKTISFKGLDSLRKIGASFLWGNEGLQTLNCDGMETVMDIDDGFCFKCLQLKHVDLRALRNVHHIGTYFFSSPLYPRADITNVLLSEQVRFLLPKDQHMRRDGVWTMRKHVLLIRLKSKGKFRKAFEVWNIMTTVGLFL